MCGRRWIAWPGRGLAPWRRAAFLSPSRKLRRPRSKRCRPDGSPAAALACNVYGVAEPPVAAVTLAVYVRQAVDSLAGQGLGALAAGGVSFPEPQAAAAAE